MKKLKEFWKLNGKNYLISMGVFSLVGAFLITINKMGFETYLTFPLYYSLGFLMAFGFSEFLEEKNGN